MFIECKISSVMHCTWLFMLKAVSSERKSILDKNICGSKNFQLKKVLGGLFRSESLEDFSLFYAITISHIFLAIEAVPWSECLCVFVCVCVCVWIMDVILWYFTSAVRRNDWLKQMLHQEKVFAFTFRFFRTRTIRIILHKYSQRCEPF